MRRTLMALVLLALVSGVTALRADDPAPDSAAAFHPTIDPDLALPDALAPIESPARAGSGEPALVTGPAGEVWLSWFESRGRGGHALRAARLDDRTWTSPITIAEGDSFLVNWADTPSLLPLAGGRMVAHWPWLSPAGGEAYDVRVAQSFDGGATWTAPITPHRDGTATEHGFVSMCPEADGVRMVWLDGRKAAGHAHGHGEGPGPDMTLRTALLRPDGGLADEAEVDGRVCDCCQTAIARSGRRIVVAYRDRDSAEVRDISVRSVVLDEWSAPVSPAADHWKIAGCPVNGPAMDAHHDLVAIAWYTAADNRPRVQAAFSTDGGFSFGEPVTVSEGEPLGRVDLVLLDDGSAVVLWLEGKASDARIVARRVRSNATWGPVLTVAKTKGSRASGFPRAVRDGHRLVVAWTEVGKPSRVRTGVLDLAPAER